MNKIEEMNSAIAGGVAVLSSYQAEMVGNHRRKSIVLRNVGRIRHFTEDEIRIVCGRETVVLTGKNLSCRIYAGHALRVEGEIGKVFFEKE